MKNFIGGIVIGSLISFLIISFFSKSKHSKTLCSNNISYDSTKYKSFDLNGNCNTIILKSIFDSGSSLKKVNNQALRLQEKSGPIENDEAIEMVKKYYEKYNPDLNNTAFIDFERKEVLNYLIEIMESDPKETSDWLRIYLGVRDTSSICAIITSVSKEKKMEMNFITPGKLLALDWGGLRPPPKRKDALEKDYFATMLVKAIEKSESNKTKNKVDTIK